MRGACFALKAWLGRINRYTVEMRIRAVLPYLKGDVLDIGCGSGYLAQFVSNEHLYIGVDINEEKIRLLKQKYVDYPNRKFWRADVDKDTASLSAISHSAFDTITLLAVIEHFRNSERVLSLLRRLLKKEGLLIITTPTSVGDKIGNLIPTITMGTRALPYPHVRIYDRASLIALVEKSSYRVNSYKKFELGANQLLICSKRLD